MFAIRFGPRDKIITAGVSVLLGVLIINMATFVWPGYQSRPTYDSFFVVAFMIMIFPPAAVDFLDRRWRLQVNSRIPDLVRNIADSQRTGMTFVKAIETSANLRYGPLSKELKRTVALMSWGYTYEQALETFAERVNTPLAYRAAVLLSEVGRSGGHLTEILGEVHSHIKDVQDLERDRRTQVVPYVAIIYAAFGVYLFVVYILFSTFFSQVKQLTESGAPFGAQISPETYYIWFFHMSIIEATIGGFVAGKMGEGAITAGLKHVLLLLAISLVIFIFFIE